MRVWIDLANSPHPLLFAPVARRLEEMGDAVGITFRDNAQTRELARDRFADAELIGLESPPSRVRKAISIGSRAVELRRWAKRFKPDVALSHNSYAQLIAARTAGVPAVTAMDYEHQPANQLAFRLAARVLVPECFPQRTLGRAGAGGKAQRYPGFKEELYLADFSPDQGIRGQLGIADDARVAVIRTPPSRAVYHRMENHLLEPVTTRLCGAGWVTVVLARHPEQIAEIQAGGSPNLIVPRRAVDSRSLMQLADLFVGAGGTMTREAALLGVPSMTIFAGKPAAVDQELERLGKLARLTEPAQVDEVPVSTPRERQGNLDRVRERGQAVLEIFVDAVHDVGEGP